MAVQVRRARPEDLAAAGEVTVAAYAPFTQPTDAYVARLGDAATRAAEAELWVAVDGAQPDARVLGNVTTCPPGSPWREVAGAHEGEFRMLAVAPDAQGRGVGAALLDHVLAVFREQGFDAAVLSSLPEMAGAHRLYVRHGFVRRPERDWGREIGVELIVFDRDL